VQARASVQLGKPAVATNSGWVPGCRITARFPWRFRYNFNFNGGFNPTKAIIAASLKFHDYRRSADVRLTSVSMERRE
jgi:hypothetical protein